MSLSLRVMWTNRLQTASASSSFSARVEAKVLRFLLSNYAGSTEEAPLPDCPLYEGDLPYGRSRVPLTSLQQRRRLNEIARIKSESRVEPVSASDVWLQEERFWEIVRRQRFNRRRAEADEKTNAP